jgi:ribosomal protein S18 acetylase RimI-like enzyme
MTTLAQMLELSHGLPVDALAAISDLEARTIANDGGRLKLEWPTLRSRDADAINDVLWWDGPTLVGFVGIYCFDGHNAELVGMVDPSSRRRGIGTKLLDAALTLCRDRLYANVLLVTPHEPDCGGQFAMSRNGEFEHAEHALVLNGPPSATRSGPEVNVRQANLDDAGLIAELLTAAFGHAPTPTQVDIGATSIIEAEGHAIGTIRSTLDANTGGVYGFAVSPTLQGRGIGRQALRQVCEDLMQRGATRIGLEVATQNESALRLYLSLGFQKVTTEDYFSITARTP